MISIMNHSKKRNKLKKCYYVTFLPNDETFVAAAYRLANTIPPRTPLIVMGL